MKKQLDGLIYKTMWIAIILFSIRAALSWKEIQFGASAYMVFGFAGEAVGVSTIIMAIYQKWLWRFDPFTKVPYIAGKYKGCIKSRFDNKQREATLIIKQTLLGVEVSLRTDESTSRSISGSIEDIFGEPELIYTYVNEPVAEVRGRSTIHYGTGTFVIEGNRKLRGKYYTDRGTSGDMFFSNSK